MWTQAGFSPETFWDHTPLHFQMAMRGVRARMKNEAEDRVALAYQTAAFTGALNSKRGLKPLEHYLRRAPKKMSTEQMLANMRSLAAWANRAGKD